MAPLLSVVGKTGVGKTTLLEKLVRELRTRGYRVAVIKHHAHTTSLDVPGKDSWRYAEAGAEAVIIASPIEVVRFERVARERTLAEIAAGIQNVDLILTEGFKREAAPKIEVSRAARGIELIASPDDLIAVVSDYPIDFPVPRFDLDDAPGIAFFIIKYLKLRSMSGG